MYTCLMAFVGLILGAIQFTVPAAYHDLLQYAIMASFFGVAISWMYRDTFHPGRWEVHQSHLYASSERHFPDDVAHLGERVRSGLPGGEPEIHRHGTDPFLAIVLSWWIFGRTFFIVEFDDNGIVAN